MNMMDRALDAQNQANIQSVSSLLIIVRSINRRSIIKSVNKVASLSFNMLSEAVL